MIKVLDTLFNFNSGKKVNFEQGFFLGIITFTLLLFLFMV